MNFTVRRILVCAWLLLTFVTIYGAVARGTARPTSRHKTEQRSGEQGTTADSPDETARRIKDAKDAIAADPNNGGLHYQLASLLQSVGDAKGFVREMTEAIRLEPTNSLYRYVLARYYHSAGNLDQATKCAAKAVALGSKDATNLVAVYSQLLGDVLTEQRRYADAERTYERALAQFSAYVHGAYRNRFLQNERDVRAHLAAVRRKLAADRPSQRWIREDMPWFEFGIAPDKRTRAYSESRIRDLAPQIRAGTIAGEGVHKILADSYLAVGKTDDAVVEYLATVELDPKSRLTWRMLGAAYARQGRLGDGANAFLKACSLGDKASCNLSQKMLESSRRFQRFKRMSYAPH